MNINWFPGHMAKTRKQITEDLKLVDVVVELLDARIPISSQNPEIKQILQNKKKIIVLNKCDLADDICNREWVEYFIKNNNIAILVDSNTGKGIEEVTRQIQKIMEEDLKRLSEKGRTGRKIRVMIVGIPNVGKSSFINRIAKKSNAEVGNKPGVTKTKQWIRLNENIELLDNEHIELLDTPGVLWPKFESEEVALNLAFTGTIKDDILEITEIAYNLVKFLLENYQDKLLNRYSIDKVTVYKILEQNQPENENIYEIMQLIGRKRGALMSGGMIDDEKTAKIILEDFRSGKIGKISLEKIK